MSRVPKWAWYLLIAAVVLGLMLTVRSCVQTGQSDAVIADRDATSAVVRNAQIEMERQASRDQQIDELVAERARAEQMEAINDSLEQVDGDPAAAVYDRMRRNSPATR